MTVDTSRARDGRSLFLHIFGFLLLWEWVRPLSIVTDTGNIYVFIIFIAACFLLNFLRFRLLVGAFLKWFIVFFILHALFYDGFFIDVRWVSELLVDFSSNIGLIMNANWLGMSDVFRTFLFLMFLWLMSYLMIYWIILQRRILLFLILTIVYITVLDTFSPYDAKVAIVRTIIIGFIMLGMLYIERIREREGFQNSQTILLKMIIPLIVLIASSTTVGFFAPKAAPQWPDPVPYLTGYGKGDSEGIGEGIKKVGYGTNDTQLGGPFIADDTLVFTAKASKGQYWRVETKDVYTGKGWITSSNPVRRSFNQENTVLNWYEEKTGRELAEAHITLNIRYNHLIYPLELLSVQADPDVLFSVNPLTEKINTIRGTSPISLEEYSVTYNYPQFPVEQLRDLKDENFGISLESNEEFIKQYTQLPEELPERVRELAEEITALDSNRYQKVRSIESYFKQSDFSYDRKNVGVPGNDEDYVDQFLFDTKRGYCDNFSTSMIVLLRSVGIPARWVKGYSDGEYVGTTEDGLRSYEITNNNAHSWVEAYFPGYGWIPFEPTIGFTNPSEFVYDLSLNDEETDAVQTPEIEKPEMPEPGLEEEESAGYTPKEENWFEKLKIDTSNISWKVVMGYIISILLVVFIIFKTRGKWFPFVAILLYKYRKNDKVYFIAYKVLLKRLDYYGLKRKEGQTLRDYAVYVDKFFSSNDMKNLTLSFEKALYRSDNAKEEWIKSVELWENLIKKTSS